MESTALTTLTDQQRALLEQSRKSTARPSVPFIPQIKLFNHGSPKIEGVKKGKYYTEVYDGKEKVCTSIGKSPSLVILHRAYTYSYFDKKKNALIAWTSDIAGFTDLDIVYLYNNDDAGKARIEKTAPYPEMKLYMRAKYPELMKFQNALYVLYEGQVYRMFAKNSGVCGIDPATGKPNYKKPQNWSLMHFMDKASEIHESAFYENVCKMDSVEHDDGMPFFQMTFAYEGPVAAEHLPTMIDTYGKLMHDLEVLHRMDIARMTVKAEVESQPMNVDQLPDL